MDPPFPSNTASFSTTVLLKDTYRTWLRRPHRWNAPSNRTPRFRQVHPKSLRCQQRGFIKWKQSTSIWASQTRSWRQEGSPRCIILTLVIWYYTCPSSETRGPVMAHHADDGNSMSIRECQCCLSRTSSWRCIFFVGYSNWRSFVMVLGHAFSFVWQRWFREYSYNLWRWRQFFGVKYIRIVYVESFARVTALSLSGKILLHLSDRFLVQWPELVRKYSKAEWVGILVWCASIT